MKGYAVANTSDNNLQNSHEPCPQMDSKSPGILEEVVENQSNGKQWNHHEWVQHPRCNWKWNMFMAQQLKLGIHNSLNTMWETRKAEKRIVATYTRTT